MEQEINRLRVELERAKKNDIAKSWFLTRMSKDMKTPISNILGLTAIVGTHLDDSDRVMECMNEISVSCKALLDSMGEISDMSLLECRELVLNEDKFNLSNQIQYLIQAARDEMKGKRQKLKARQMNLVHEEVIGDAQKLCKVIQNVLTNAIHHTPEEGEICLSIVEEESNRSGCAAYRVVIEDNGEEEDWELMKKMEIPFSVTEGRCMCTDQNTGLGLAVAHHMVRLMGGDLEIERVREGGTRVVVRFVLRKQEDQKLNTKGLYGRTILAVGDEPRDRQYIVMALECLGMRVEEASSGEEALRMIMEKKRKYFAVFLDWRMSEIDGIGFARTIRRQADKEIPLIFVCDQDWSKIEHEALEAGVDGFVLRPLFPSELLHRLQSFMGWEHTKRQEDGSRDRELDGKNVLLVESGRQELEADRKLLEEAGALVDTVQTGQQALELFGASGEGIYDLVLLNIDLPDMDGYETAEKLRALRRKDAALVPVFAVINKAFSSDRKRFQESGINESICRPWNPQEFESLLLKWL